MYTKEENLAESNINQTARAFFYRASSITAMRGLTIHYYQVSLTDDTKAI